MTYTFRRLTMSGAAVMAAVLAFTASAHAEATPTTSAASSVMTVAATLNGSLSTDGSSTVFQFQYGTTDDYGQTTPTQTLPAAVPATVPARASITDLRPDTTYHYRLVSSTGDGTAYYPLEVTYGADETFTTDKAGTTSISFPGTSAGVTPTLAIANGIIPLPPLSCASVDACQGSVTISSRVRLTSHAVSDSGHRVRYRTVVLAQQRFSVPAGKSRKVHPKLSRGGRNLLKRRRRARRVTLYVKYTTGQRPIKKVIALKLG